MSNERISVHVCTRNRPTELYGLLLSLRYQTLQSWDLVLIDDSDKPIINFKPVFDIINRLRFDGHMVKYIRNQFPTLNIGVNRNMAIQRCPNKIGCRIDDDSVCNPDYLERLYSMIRTDKKIGAAGGVVPPLGNPKYTRKPPKIFNGIVFHKDRVELYDDGGYSYEPESVLPSHHLRSSFMYRNEAVRKAGMHPSEYGAIGFREETDLSIRIIMAGYRLLTDTGAVCWHAQATSGGARIQNYQQAVKVNDMHFQRKFLRYKKLGKIKEGMFGVIK